MAPHNVSRRHLRKCKSSTRDRRHSLRQRWPRFTSQDGQGSSKGTKPGTLWKRAAELGVAQTLRMLSEVLANGCRLRDVFVFLFSDQTHISIWRSQDLTRT